MRRKKKGTRHDDRHANGQVQLELFTDTTEVDETSIIDYIIENIRSTPLPEQTL